MKNESWTLNVLLLVCLDEMVSEDPEQNESSKSDRVALGVATGWVIVRHRPYRRNLLFISTLLTLIMVFLGAVPLTQVLAKNPIWFALYWIACFCLVGFVLLLACYDLIAIRKDHREKMKSLERELSDAAEEARRLAEEAAEEKSSGT